MNSKKFVIFFLLAIAPMISVQNGYTNDLDDDIKIDDDISGYDSIKMEKNTSFISQKAQARASAGAKKIKDEMGISGHDSVDSGSSSQGSGGGVNVGGVNIGAGAKHKGDIYIVIQDSEIEASDIKK